MRPAGAKDRPGPRAWNRAPTRPKDRPPPSFSIDLLTRTPQGPQGWGRIAARAERIRYAPRRPLGVATTHDSPSARDDQRNWSSRAFRAGGEHLLPGCHRDPHRRSDPSPGTGIPPRGRGPETSGWGLPRPGRPPPGPRPGRGRAGGRPGRSLSSLAKQGPRPIRALYVSRPERAMRLDLPRPAHLIGAGRRLSELAGLFAPAELPWEGSAVRRPVHGGTFGVLSGAMAMHRVLPASRLRLRTLMLLVLLAAIALETERAWGRRQEYLARAAYHAAAEARLAGEARAFASELARYRPVLRRPGCGNPRRYAEALDSVRATVAARAAAHGRLKERYLKAASRPWEPGPG
jgi:hypothetical protein